MNKLIANSRRLLDKYCKYVLILLFFASFTLSIFYSAKYYSLDLKMVYTESGEVKYFQRFAYEIEAWFQYGISLLGSVLCGVGLLAVAMISAYGAVCSFGFFSVPKDSLKGRKCLLVASIIGTMASFVLIMGFLLCGTHKWYAHGPMEYSVTPPWHIWLPLPTFLLLLCLSIFGNEDTKEIRQPIAQERNTPITRIIFAILAVFCIITAVITLGAQYKIPYTVQSTEMNPGKVVSGAGKVWALIGELPYYISPVYSGIIVGNVFCTLLLMLGAVLAILEGLSEYHYRFRSLGIIGFTGILGFAHLYFGFKILPDDTDAIFNNIEYYIPKFVISNLWLFAVLFVIYILYTHLKLRREEHKNEEST